VALDLDLEALGDKWRGKKCGGEGGFLSWGKADRAIHAQRRGMGSGYRILLCYRYLLVLSILLLLSFNFQFENWEEDRRKSQKCKY